jgi:hypothetical protein
MPSRRSCAAPAADLFTAEERRVLQSWLGNDINPAVERILAKWQLEPPPTCSTALDVAVAAVLQRVQLRNPRLGATVAPVPRAGGGMVFAVDQRQRMQSPNIVPLSRHLFTLQWLDHRDPDVFEPSTYRATPLPGTDKIVLAVSDEGDSSCRTASDVAIGWAPGSADFPESIGNVVRRQWSTLRDQANFPRWAQVRQAGLLDEAILGQWADAVWP